MKMRLLSLSIALLVLPACGGLRLFDVVKAPVEDCVINPAGEFCGDVGGPSQEKWAIEPRGESTVVYIGEETWVAAGTEGGLSVIKEERSTREPGPCTTSRRRTLTWEVSQDDQNNDVLQGSFEVSDRIEGPDACGDTPRGNRVLFQLNGVPATSF